MGTRYIKNSKRDKHPKSPVSYVSGRSRQLNIALTDESGYKRVLTRPKCYYSASPTGAASINWKTTHRKFIRRGSHLHSKESVVPVVRMGAADPALAAADALAAGRTHADRDVTRYVIGVIGPALKWASDKAYGLLN